jgi:hypothetical protein
MGASASWNPQGLSRPVMGSLYLYLSGDPSARVSVDQNKPWWVSSEQLSQYKARWENDIIICKEENIWSRIAHYNLAGRTEKNQKNIIRFGNCLSGF